MSETAQNGYVILGRQVAKGTPAAVMGPYGLKVTSNAVGGQAERLDDEPEIGGGRDNDSGTAIMGGFKIGGDLEGQLRPKAIGLLFLAAGFSGGAPVQDGVTGAYTHTLIPAAPTYLTVEGRWGTTDAIRRGTDVLVDELKLSLSANGKASWSASLIGITEDWRGAPSVPTYETDPILDYYGSAITLDGLGTYRWEDVELTISNNLSDDEYVIGSRLLDDMTPGAREVTVGGTIKVGSNAPSVTDLYRAAVYGSKTATGPGGASPYHTSAAVVLGSAKFAGTSNTVRYGLTVTVPDLVLTGFPLEASGDERLTVDLEGKAYKGAGDVATVAIRNTFATAYNAA